MGLSFFLHGGRINRPFFIRIRITLFYANRNTGFTFIELLIVIVIIAILASIAILYYIDLRALAIESTMLSDARNCASKAEAWGAHRNTYVGFNANECVVTHNNSLIVANVTTSTYSISVRNPSARTNRTVCTIDNTGQISWQ